MPYKTQTNIYLDAVSAVLWASASLVQHLCLGDALSAIWSPIPLPDQLDIRREDLELYLSLSAFFPSKINNSSRRIPFSWVPPLCLKLSKFCTHELFLKQSHGDSGEQGMLPFPFAFGVLFLPLTTGDSQTLAFLWYSTHHADCSIHLVFENRMLHPFLRLTASYPEADKPPLLS